MLARCHRAAELVTLVAQGFEWQVGAGGLKHLAPQAVDLGVQAAQVVGQVVFTQGRDNGFLADAVALAVKDRLEHGVVVGAEFNRRQARSRSYPQSSVSLTKSRLADQPMNSGQKFLRLLQCPGSIFQGDRIALVIRNQAQVFHLIE